jgi:hypothetical protein
MNFDDALTFPQTYHRAVVMISPERVYGVRV